MRFGIVIVIWTVLWVNFIARDCYKHNCLSGYTTLIKRDIDGKRSYTYGDYFYEFLKFAEQAVPVNASYEFVGVEDFSLAARRAIYYLYPRLKKEHPEYLLVYSAPGYKTDGYALYSRLDGGRFVLKKVESRE